MPIPPAGHDHWTEVSERLITASWNVLACATLDDAAAQFLGELLEDDPVAACAFLALAVEGEEPHYWGRDKTGAMWADASYRLNHRAMRRALAGDALFVVDGMSGGEGAACGHECFISRGAAGDVRVAAALRRPLGATPYREAEAQGAGGVFLSLLRAFEAAVLRDRFARPAAVSAGIPGEMYHGLTCRSEAMRRLVGTIEKIKNDAYNVCVSGESGSGKEMVARAIHHAGAGPERPFVGESCGAIAESLIESELFGHVKGAFTGADEDKEGLFAIADGGTLFLDEIGDMPGVMQSKLLRVLQEGVVRPVGAAQGVKVRVRVISSTLGDLERMIARGTFRADLYWRLNVVGIHVPPLRERKEDLPLLIGEFTERLRGEGLRVRPLSESALRAAQHYHWPGNVRQLQSVLRRAMLTCERREVGKKDLMQHAEEHGTGSWIGEGFARDATGVSIKIPSRGTFKSLIAECEKAILVNAMREHHGNKSKVTRALKIPRQSLYNKLERHGLERSGEEQV